MDVGNMLEGLFSGVASGGLTGLAGLAVQGWLQIKQQGHQLAMTKLQLDAAREMKGLELQSSERVAARQAEAEEIEARLAAQTAADAEDTKRLGISHTSDAPTYSPTIQLTGDGWFTRGVRALIFALMGLVDVIRGLMRPGLTAYSMVLLTLVFLWVQDMHKRLAITYTAAEGKALTGDVVETISYLAVTFGVWWFGGRLLQRGQR